MLHVLYAGRQIATKNPHPWTCRQVCYTYTVYGEYSYLQYLDTPRRRITQYSVQKQKVVESKIQTNGHSATPCKQALPGRENPQSGLYGLYVHELCDPCEANRVSTLSPAVHPQVASSLAAATDWLHSLFPTLIPSAPADDSTL